jgi:curved DNA-binding protein CbpA
MNHYEVLAMVPGDDPRAAFHRFSERFHPDVYGQPPQQLLSALRRIYQAGTEAYRVLRDARLRSEYDLSLAKAKEPGASGTSATSLEELCATKGGKLHARQAERALTDGNLAEAGGLLERALRAEGPNPALEERLEAVRSLLFLSGG